MSERPRCQGFKKNGEPCRTVLGLSADTQLCLNHDPLRHEAARAVSVAGGKASGIAKRERAAKSPDDPPPKPDNLKDNSEYCSWTIDQLARGKINPRDAHEIFYGLNAHKAAVEKRDLERQVKQLRAELADARKVRRA